MNDSSSDENCKSVSGESSFVQPRHVRPKAIGKPYWGVKKETSSHGKTEYEKESFESADGEVWK